MVHVPYYSDIKHPPTDDEIIDILANYFSQITIFSKYEKCKDDTVVFYKLDKYNNVTNIEVITIPYKNEYSEIHKDFKPSGSYGWLGGNVITDKEVIKKVLEYFLR